MSGDQSTVEGTLTGTIMVTGGAGFIGSSVVRRLMANSAANVINVDKLTYAANLASLEAVAADPRYCLERVDICDRAGLARVFAARRPTAVLHLAAETHVDRSIDGPAAFIETNVVGTCTLLEVSTEYWRHLDPAAKAAFRFHHVSTDEVFGALGETGAFTEDTPYRPNSPYSASKAASDHFVRAWHHTYGLPVVTSNCSNNYGPWQFPEKLVPLVTLNALQGLDLPVYGKGDNVRDWLFVDDHAAALLLILGRGALGETYNVGGHGERRNLAVVEAICDAVDALAPALASGAPRRSLIRFVEDRPGHDFRYAIDDAKISTELGWQPQQSFESGLKRTVSWYLENDAWWAPLRDRVYSGARLGRLAGGSV